jgi:hypothetical protein
MRRILSIACLALLAPHTVLAGGTFPLKHLRPILEREPALAKHLFSTLDFAEWGVSSRVGSTVNERLGGARLGPYRILAKPKGAAGGYTFEVVVYTKKTFLDGSGKEVTLADASSIVERFDYLEIRPVADKSRRAAQQRHAPDRRHAASHLQQTRGAAGDAWR